MTTVERGRDFVRWYRGRFGIEGEAHLDTLERRVELFRGNQLRFSRAKHLLEQREATLTAEVCQQIRDELNTAAVALESVEHDLTKVLNDLDALLQTEENKWRAFTTQQMDDRPWSPE